MIGPSLRYRLERFVEALNGKLRREQTLGLEQEIADQKRIREAPAHLRQLVESWRKCGLDPRVINSEKAALWREITAHWQKLPTVLVQTSEGGAGIWWNSRPDPDPRGEALRWFIEFLMNPECVKLAGPCDRCGNYYIRKSARNKVYCSRSCGAKATATAATKRAREEKHQKKLARAREAIRQYVKAGTRMPWKHWVATKERAAEITPKFLTRAVNSGELQVPSRISSKEK